MSQRNQGIFYVLCSAFFFSLMNLFVRLAGDVPVMQKCFFRNLVAFVIALVMVLKNHVKMDFKGNNLLYLFLRSSIGLLGVIGNFYALGKLNISDASMLNKLSPFFAIIFSTILLKEKANKVEWGAVVIAFIGAMFVAKPTFNMESIPALAGFLGGMCAGFAYTCVRKLTTNGVPGQQVVLFFSGFSCLVLSPVLIFNYSPMEPKQWLSLLMAGIAAAGGQFFITAAYSKAPAKEISVFDYTLVIFAAILGFFVLDQVPDVWSMIGYVIIIGVAFAKWRYNLKLDNM